MCALLCLHSYVCTLMCVLLCVLTTNRAVLLRYATLPTAYSDLEDNRGLTRLDVSFCGLDDTAAGHLASLIANHSTLAWLDLSGNAIGWHGGEALAGGLTPNAAVYDPKLAYPRLR